jgi:AcrR family transcriptional regulator
MSQRNPRTKELLLAAAREEFAAHGIAGARVDRIAERANVNKERIYGYFGNKEKLFDAVITDALDRLAAAVPLTAADDPAEYVGRVYDFHRDNPALLRLMLWEALHYREGELPNESERAARYRQKAENLAGALGQPPSREIALRLLTLIGLAAWPLAVPQFARIIQDTVAEPQDGPEPASVREQLVAFARLALDRPTGTRRPNGAVPAEARVSG